MNKSELIDAAAESSGMTKADMQVALDSLLDTITDRVKQGEKVSITGFGNFELRERGARSGRNPQTGEKIEVAASRAPAFKPGKAFKEAVS